MPDLDSWLAITIRLPVAVLIGGHVGLLALIIWAVRRYRRRSAERVPAAGGPPASASSVGDADRELAFARENYQFFVHNVAHEVSNPLQSIQTNLDNMVECRPDEVGRWQQYHDIIVGEIKRLARLTDNLRTLSRLETPRAPAVREPVNMKAVIEEVIMARAAEAKARGLRLCYVGPQRPARVMGDRDRLLRVVLNLVDNGIKYSDEGTVTVSIREEVNRLVVGVTDEGLGIAEEDMPRIFDLAYRAPSGRSFHRQGSGLGLAVVRRIVGQHGGSIQVDSLPGEGATFTFDLPLQAQEK
jgi:two-component system, OmpR family, phosphate regulon sensor histidine kinase PhoR